MYIADTQVDSFTIQKRRFLRVPFEVVKRCSPLHPLHFAPQIVQGLGLVHYELGSVCDAVPEVAQLRNVFKYWAGATCPSIPPTLAVDNDLQLLEAESPRRDGSLSPYGRLRVETAGTPGP